MFDLITIGDPVIDTHVQIDTNCDDCEINKIDSTQLCLTYGAKIPIVDSFQSLGGNAPNVAVAAAKLGLKSALISTIGGDANGRMVKQDLERHHVNVDMISVDADAQTRYSIILNYRGERTILSYSAEKKYVWPEIIPATSWVYYTGLSKGFEVVQDALLSHLRDHQTTRLAINPGSYIIKYAKQALLEMLPLTDILIVNLEEAEMILGVTLEHEKRHEALIHELLALGPDEVVLTDGKQGSWAGTKDDIWHLDAFPVEVTAKTGAGDAFSAAYLCARHRGHDIPTALRWGTANSTAVIQHHGPHKGLLGIEGLESMLEQFGSVKSYQL
jgi:sugar/nucleoside kinase (ribokinase family)